MGRAGDPGPGSSPNFQLLPVKLLMTANNPFTEQHGNSSWRLPCGGCALVRFDRYVDNSEILGQELPPGIRQSRHSIGYRLPGGHHPCPGNTGHGPATACAGDPGKDSYHTLYRPPTSRYRTSAPPDRNHYRLPRSDSGVSQAIGQPFDANS